MKTSIPTGILIHGGNGWKCKGSGCLKVPVLAALQEFPVPHLDSPIEVIRSRPCDEASFDDFPTITRADWNYVARCCLANGDHKGTL